MVKRRRKTRTHLKGPNNSAASSTSAPKSFIIRTGKVPRSVSTLVQDTRKVMEPNTATRLRERNNNKLKDFISMAGPIGVTHLLIFGQTEAGTNLRILRAPRGPTLTFRVNKYALAKDVQASSRRPTPPGSEFVTPPLLVLNNFGGEERQIKLLVATFQNLFPPIQVQSMKLSQARRIVLLNYNSATGTIDWRHYLISVRPVGVSKSVRRVVEGTRSRSSSSKLPNLSSTQDISDYILNRTSTGGPGSEFETDASEAESEAEDVADPRNKVHLHDRYVGRGNAANTQKAVRLREIGPRMELKLVKIEEGCNEGAVLFHEYIKKSAQEQTQQHRDHVEKLKLQQQRREEQEQNVERKRAEKAELRKASRRNAGLASDSDEAADDEDDSDAASEGEEEEDEFAYEDQFAPDAAEGAQDEELFDDHEDDKSDASQEDSDDDDDEAGQPWNPTRGESGYDNPPGIEPYSDESDLEPIPLGDLQHDYNSADDWPEYSDDDDDAEPAPRKKTAPSKAAPAKSKSAAPKKKVGRR